MSAHSHNHAHIAVAPAAAIDAALIQAYRETVYTLQRPTPLALRVDEANDALRVVHDHKVIHPSA